MTDPKPSRYSTKENVKVVAAFLAAAASDALMIVSHLDLAEF